MEEFRAGLTAVLRSWSALRTAVESGWGGNESQAKANDLRENLYSVFDGSSCPPKTLTQDDLEDNLAIYLEEEFSVTLEDGSERQVADVLWRMYEQCYRGDTSLARQMVTAASNAIELSATYPVKVQTTEHDEEEDDDAMYSSSSILAMQDYAAESLFGGPKRSATKAETLPPARQLGEPEPDKMMEEVDEDGFAPVQTRRRRNKPT